MSLRAALLLLLCIVALPSAAAQAPAGTSVERITDRITQTADGIVALQSLEFVITNVQAFNQTPRAILTIDQDALNPTFSLGRGVERRTLVQAAVTLQPTQEPGWKTYQLNLSGAFPTYANGDRLVLTVNHTQTDSTYERRLSVAAPRLVVYATGHNGLEPFSTQLGDFNPTLNGSERHAVRNEVPSDFTYTLRFESATSQAPQATDLNPYLMGLAGLIIGAGLAWLLLRRQPRAKKFQKGGEMESAAMLEARRRTLMAALKELELAHESKEIPDAAYAPLKEEYKAQTVRVLRSLEEKKEAPTKQP